MSNKIYSARGATTIETDTKEEVTEKSVTLFNELIQKNNLNESEIINLIISTTADIHSFYPARAVRENCNMNIPLFSALEPEIDGALKLCIRMMLTFQKPDCDIEVKHVYLERAKALRPDIK